MGIFNKRNFNKNAKNPPKIRKDFFSMASESFKIDGFAFKDIDRIAGEIGKLNYAIYDVKTKQKVKKHPLYAVLKQPNLDERHFNFFYQSVVDYFNKGVFWLKSKYDGEVVSLFRLNPDDVVIDRDSATNRRIFQYNGNRYTSDDIIYIPSRFDYSTLTGGASIFDAVRNAFTTSKDLEKYTQATFKNGILGKRMMVDVTGAYPDLTDEQALEIKADLNAQYMGIENASKPLLKYKGIEYSEIGSASDNRAAELTENKRLQKEVIDSIFQMPDESFDTEKYFLMLNEFAISPIATQLQEEINSMLDEKRFYFEFDYNGLMKVSLSTRVDTEIKQVNNGLLSIDEARALENRSPIEAGDTHFMPVNMMPWTEEIKQSYMAKQKQIAQQQTNDPTDENTQHIPQGDDKQ